MQQKDGKEHDRSAGDGALRFHDKQQVAAGRGDVVDSRHRLTKPIPVFMMPMRVTSS